MYDLLWLLLVRQGRQDELAVVRRKPTVHEEGVIDDNVLRNWFLYFVLLLEGLLHSKPLNQRLFNGDELLCEEERANDTFF